MDAKSLFRANNLAYTVQESYRVGWVEKVSPSMNCLRDRGKKVIFTPVKPDTVQTVLEETAKDIQRTFSYFYIFYFCYFCLVFSFFLFFWIEPWKHETHPHFLLTLIRAVQLLFLKVIGKIFLLWEFFRACSKMKSAQWGFSFTKSNIHFLKQRCLFIIRL